MYFVDRNLFSHISPQVGYDKQGLPIGLQLIGRPWAEATILRLAAAVEVFLTVFLNIHLYGGYNIKSGLECAVFVRYISSAS